MTKEDLLNYFDREYISKNNIAAHIPLGTSLEDIWREVLSKRLSRSSVLPLNTADNKPYWYVLTDKMIEASEKIVEEYMNLPKDNTHISTISTIEEVFFTSYVEGSRIQLRDAMDFLQSDNDPQDVEELMLYNNRQAGCFAADRLYSPIDLECLSNMAYILTDSMDNGSGLLRTSDTEMIPYMEGESYSLPHSYKLSECISELTAFLANAEIHPLIKSAAAQAYILSIRPFPEGNERLGRLVSSMILIRAGYRFFSKISLSSIIARDSYSYYQAVINTIKSENNGDMTYFIEYYLELLSQGIDELRTKRKQEEEKYLTSEQDMAELPLSTSPENRISASFSDAKQQIIDSLDNRIKFGQGTSPKIAAFLKSFLNTGKNMFSTKEIAESVNVGINASKNTLNAFVKYGILLREGDRNGYAEYSFNLMNTSQNTSDLYASKTGKSILNTLNDLFKASRGVPKAVLSVLIKYLKTGKITFTSKDIESSTGSNLRCINSALKRFEEKNVIKLFSDDKSIEDQRANVYSFNLEYQKDIPVDLSNYSESVLDMIDELRYSSNSSKDKRLGELIYNALTKGILRYNDYTQNGFESKWVSDMKTATSYGLVEKINTSEYRINTDLISSPDNINTTQKNSLAKLYEFFGDSTFSAEMVVANLDYTAGKTAAVLHQFTLMKILDCRKENVYQYRFLINPEDNPEWFSEVA